MIGTRAVLFVALLLRVALRSVFRAVECSVLFDASRWSMFRAVQYFAHFTVPRRSDLRGFAVTRRTGSRILKHLVGLLGNFLLIRVGLCFGAHGCVARFAEC